MDRVKDKVVIVTGGATGMGRADAVLLAREGAQVVVTDVDEKGGHATVEESGTDRALFMALNTAKEEQWQSVVSATLERFGRLDGLVNNAGIIHLGSVVDTSLELWRKIMAVNLEGVFLGCKHALPAIEKGGRGGSIVNMSSSAAMHGVSYAAAYSASKGGVRSLTKSVAMYCREKRNHIRCNSIHPDGVRTNMSLAVTAEAQQVDVSKVKMPAGVHIDPEDIAWLVVYLMAEESRFLSGAELPVDDCALITPPLGPDAG